jgi:hypothetical protein
MVRERTHWPLRRRVDEPDQHRRQDEVKEPEISNAAWKIPFL